ncbi:Alcohol dehydrogenase ADH3 [Aphelenchoides bicaudatus]|nr:Alcohol dehydrogenase ADH3 [Aphelenchoides bicaudatus]
MPEKLPSTYKAAVYERSNDPITIRDVVMPEPGHDEVLVKVLFSGVCHSDLHGWKGDFPKEMPFKYPIVGGHEGSGIVVKLGSNVTNLKLNDKVGIKWMGKCCKNCVYCRKSLESSCLDPVYNGFYCDGTFQQYAIANALEVIPLPDEINMAEAAPLFCAGMTVYRGLLETNLKAGETIAIVGCGGGLGSIAAQFAKAMGFHIIGIDLKSKKHLCEAVGVEHFISADSDVPKQILELTGLGAHAVLNVATSTAAIEASLNYVRPRGTVILIGLPAGAIKVDLFSTIMRCITPGPSLVGNRQDAIDALDFMKRGLVKVPIELHTLKDLPEIFEKMERGEITGRAVIDLWK